MISKWDKMEDGHVSGVFRTQTTANHQAQVHNHSSEMCGVFQSFIVLTRVIRVIRV